MKKLILVVPLLFVSSFAVAGSSGGDPTGIRINVPEPASIAVLAVGVAAVLRYRNRRK